MTSLSPVRTQRADEKAAIAVLLIAEATLFFTFVFFIGPLATIVRLLPLALMLILCAALYWGQAWARWGLMATIAFRTWRVVPVVAAAWALGRTAIALFFTLIVLAELAGGFLLLDGYLSQRQKVMEHKLV